VLRQAAPDANAALRCRAHAQRPPAAQRRTVLALLAISVASLGGTGRAGDAQVAWRDIESRIQYGYYTEDRAALGKLEELIDAGDPHDTLRGYYAGLLAWRRALLAAPAGAAAQGGSTAHYAQRCVSAIDASLTLAADFAEGLALRAACLSVGQEVSGGYAPFAGHRAHKDLERARQLAVRNPRVLLVDAMGDYTLAPSQGGNKERALGKLRQTVAAFEAERGGPEHLPGWGAAEAWLLLAQDLLDHGDTVAARDALEHALLIAPEFAQARRLMAKITSG